MAYCAIAGEYFPTLKFTFKPWEWWKSKIDIQVLIKLKNLKIHHWTIGNASVIDICIIIIVIYLGPNTKVQGWKVII